MIKIRLRRMGAKRRPFYRIVAAEHHMRRDGRFIEVLGNYDPLTDPPTINVKADRIQHYLSNGAKPTETVEGLLKRAGVIPADARYNHPRVFKPAASPAEAPEPAAADETAADDADATPAEDALES